MKIGTSIMSRSIDNYCIENLKIPSIILMENAAGKVVEHIKNRYSSFVVVCGKGNNGGDGFAVARGLIVLGKMVEVFLVGGDDHMSPDCRKNYEIIKNMGIKVNPINNVEDVTILRDSISKIGAVIDCIFGTGLSRNIEGIYDYVISVINENSSYTISIDIPSGLNADTGEVMGNSIRAKETISFEFYKGGFLNYGTDMFTGEIHVVPIGIPEEVISKFHSKEYIIEESTISETIRIRNKYYHKGDFGRVLIFAGSEGFSGAAYLSTEAAVMTGSGLTTLCCPKSIRDVLSIKLSEAMTITFEEKDRILDVLNNSNAVAFGPGLGNNNETLELLKLVISNIKSPLVLDADGINVLTDRTILENIKAPVIITPHVGEMARLTGLETQYINANRIEVAKNYALNTGTIVLLKGYNTVITDGSRVFINPTGNSAMASGGMGDSLTGIITSFLGQGYRPLEAACLGAYVHGYCGDKLSKQMFCVSATHLIEELPYVIKDLQK